MDDEARAGATVLVVEADPAERDRFGAWLEEERYDVLTCPGPGEPDYSCVGDREGTCPLLAEAGVVILDMSTASEAVMTGTTSEELLALYLLHGSRIVALGSHPGEEVPGRLLRLRRHPDRDLLLGAVRSLVAPGTST